MTRSTFSYILTGLFVCLSITNIVLYALHTAVWGTIEFSHKDFNLVLIASGTILAVAAICYWVGRRYHNEELWEQHFDSINREEETWREMSVNDNVSECKEISEP